MKFSSRIFLQISLLFSVVIAPFNSVYAAQQHGLFTQVLGDYVREGSVDYKNLCKDGRLQEYLDQLSKTDLRSLTKEESMAYWINAYNAFTLQLICKNYPLKSIGQLHSGGLIFGSIVGKTAWDKPFITINDKTYSLGFIEHKILRPQYKDPRIHFAIVCAARSCPPLRSEAYEGYKLNDQLNNQGWKFLIDRSDLNSFDRDKKIAHLSSVFSWFLKDFGRNSGELLNYLCNFLPADLANDIKANPSQWKIKYKTYDWGLNEM